MTIMVQNSSDTSWERMLKNTSSESLLLLCQRLQLEEEWRDSMQEPSVFLEAYFLEHPESFLILLSKEDYELLIRIWEENNFLSNEYINQQNIVPLEKLGLIQYRHKKREILVCEEAKNNFYFYLKSRSSRQWVDQYQKLEYAVKGMLYQCGIIELTQFYDIIINEKDSSISTLSQFRQFLIGRIELWSFLGVLKNYSNGDYYIISHEVKDRDQVFWGWVQQEIDSFHKLLFDEAIFLGKMSGIGNWQGTKALLSYCLQTIYDDMIAATVFVKTVLLYIQNGDSIETIFEKLESKIEMFTEEETETIHKYIDQMYWNTPIYNLKGYSRQEMIEKERNFSVVKGGKKD